MLLKTFKIGYPLPNLTKQKFFINLLSTNEQLTQLNYEKFEIHKKFKQYYLQQLPTLFEKLDEHNE